MMLARISGSAVVAVWLAAALPPPHAAVIGSEAQSQSLYAAPKADFEPFDSGLWFAWNQGRTIDHLESLGSDPVAAMALLALRGRPAEAIEALGAIVDGDPVRIPAAIELLETHSQAFLPNAASGGRETLPPILERAQRGLSSLPRELAAATAFRIVGIQARVSQRGRDDWRVRTSRMVEAYAGTRAAASAGLELIHDQTEPRRIAALERFARAHPGTPEGAEALFKAAESLARYTGVGFEDNPEPDPTSRFFRVLEMARELGGGAWPDSEWVRRAPTLVTGFYAYEPKYAPANIDRLITAYRGFIDAHLGLAGAHADVLHGIAYVIANRLPALLEARGRSRDDIDAIFDEWASRPARSAFVRYLQAKTYASWIAEAPAEQPRWAARAQQQFESVAASGAGIYSQRALRDLAILHIERRRDFAAAIPVLTRYLASYPASGWSWEAALRLAQMHEETGDWPAAAEAYERAARAYQHEPLASVLGHAGAARAREAMGDLASALDRFQRARQAWDDDYASQGTYVLRSGFLTFRPKPGPPPTSAQPFTRASLAADVARLERAISSPGGALFTRGRARFAEGAWAPAVLAFDELIASAPDSPFVSEANYRRQLALLHTALDFADVEGASPDPAAARRVLARVEAAPWDPAVGLAQIASASLLVATDPHAARGRLRSALERWSANQAPAPPVTDVDSDVAAIRELVFRPAGGDPYTRERRWEAFPSKRRPFVVVKPEIPVVTKDRTQTTSAAVRWAPDVRGIVLMDAEQIAMLARIVEAIGGTRTREPQAIMEVPHQPIGGARAIVTLWDELFEALPGHWGGWIFETAPVVTRLEFLDAARTKAAVKVTLRYEGVTVVLEKQQGVWKVVKLTDRWIT